MAASRSIKPRGTMVSEFSKMISPVQTCFIARLTLPTNPRLRSLVITRINGAAENCASNWVMRRSGDASSTTTA